MHGYHDFLVILGTAGILIPLMMRLGMSSAIAFMAAGVFLGPNVLGKLAAIWPVFQAFELSAQNALPALAELGVVFLFFVIGLELTFQRLKTMRHMVFGLGALQMAFCTAVLAIALLATGLDTRTAIIIGLALAFSSTAVVVQHLSDTHRLGTQAGRASFAILLFQDLAVIPVLLLLEFMQPDSRNSMVIEIARALLQAGIAAAAIIVLGRFALQPLMRLVASTNSPEFFLSAVLFAAMGTGAIAASLGLSMSLGAFLAGLLLAETEYRRAIEAMIEPFKGLLLGIFFLMVGVNLDSAPLLNAPLQIAVAVFSMIAAKSLLTYALSRFFNLPKAAARETSMLLGPGGEFAFVVFSTAAAANLMSKTSLAFAANIVALSMICIPAMAALATRWNATERRAAMSAEATAAQIPEQPAPHVIIAGFGRVGKTVASLLKEHGIPYLAIDHATQAVTRERKAGEPIYYGDATNLAFLEKCGLHTASTFAVTMDKPSLTEEILRTVHAARPELKIIARARDEKQAMRMYDAGVTEAVPETIEASLQLAEALLVAAGIPMGLAIASIHERRDQSRQLLGRPNRREQVRTMRRKRPA